MDKTVWALTLGKGKARVHALSSKPNPDRPYEQVLMMECGLRLTAVAYYSSWQEVREAGHRTNVVCKTCNRISLSSGISTDVAVRRYDPITNALITEGKQRRSSSVEQERRRNGL